MMLPEERKLDSGQLKVTMSSLYKYLRIHVCIGRWSYMNYNSDNGSSNHFTPISSFNPYANPVIIFNRQEFRSKRINYHAALSHIKQTLVRSILEYYLLSFFPSRHSTGEADSHSRHRGLSIFSSIHSGGREK